VNPRTVAQIVFVLADEKMYKKTFVRYLWFSMEYHTLSIESQESVGGSGAMWNMGQNETSFYFCMKQVLKLVSYKNRGMFHFAPCST
jgi:hypothetical protein